MFRRTDDSHEFKPGLAELEDEPLNPLGRTVFWLVVLVILFLAGWTYWGKVDVVVAGRGKIIPVGESKVLQPLTGGVVSSILVREGDRVAKGQVLMEIDPSNTAPELASKQESARHLELELMRLAAVLNRKAFDPPAMGYDPEAVAVQQRLYAANMIRLEKQRQAKRDELQQVKAQQAEAAAACQRIRYLRDSAGEKVASLVPVRDIISKDQYGQAEREWRSYEGNLSEAEHRGRELVAAAQRILDELSVIEASERDRLLSELAEKRNELNLLEAEITKTTFINARQQLVAPVNGYINKLFIHTIGGVVSPAEKLIALVPDDSPLAVSVLVQNRDIGFIARDKEATVKVDAFNFQKYGTLPGRVVNVGKDSIEDREYGLVFEVLVEPRQTSLLVEGKQTPMTIGMTVTAEIQVGKRRIIEFFVYPLIKYLDEGISVL